MVSGSVSAPKFPTTGTRQPQTIIDPLPIPPPPQRLSRLAPPPLPEATQAPRAPVPFNEPVGCNSTSCRREALRIQLAHVVCIVVGCIVYHAICKIFSVPGSGMGSAMLNLRLWLIRSAVSVETSEAVSASQPRLAPNSSSSLLASRLLISRLSPVRFRRPARPPALQIHVVRTIESSKRSIKHAASTEAVCVSSSVLSSLCSL